MKNSKTSSTANGVWKPFKTSNVMVFEIDKEYIGEISIVPNPFFGKGKNQGKPESPQNPKEVLGFNGTACPTHYALVELKNAISEKVVKDKSTARIIFKGVKGKGKEKYAEYEIAVKA